MRAIRINDLVRNCKEICDDVVNGEAIIVSRPHKKNVVVIAESEYNDMLKARQNAEFLAKLDRADKDISEGRAIIKTLDELKSMESQ